jgi:hypothetical protein
VVALCPQCEGRLECGGSELASQMEASEDWQGGGGPFYRPGQWGAERSDGDQIGGEWSSFKSSVCQFLGRGGDELMREKAGEEAPLRFRTALESSVGARYNGEASLGGSGPSVLEEEDGG